MSDEANIVLPFLPPKAKEVVNAILDARFKFRINGKDEEFIPSEITPEIIMNEGRRILTLPDLEQQSNEMYANLAACVHILKDCQELATALSQVQDGLVELYRQVGPDGPFVIVHRPNPDKQA